jgi:hypothetical protein
MKIMNLFKFTFTVALALLITGCGSDDDNSPAAAPLAPAAIPGGVVMAINPTITLNGGGNTGTFSYENLAGDIADFPTVDVAALGNWTFTRNSDTEFTLLIDFTDVLINDLTLVFSGFVGNSSSISSMRVSIQGGATDINVDLSGTPLVPTAPPATGGTGGGSGSLPPDTVLGMDYNKLTLEYIEVANVPGNFPYALNDMERFTFSSSGQLFIGDAQTNLGLPVSSPNANNFLYEDSARGLFFGVSVINGDLNEINVLGGPTGPFYGQFVEGTDE